MHATQSRDKVVEDGFDWSWELDAVNASSSPSPLRTWTNTLRRSLNPRVFQNFVAPKYPSILATSVVIVMLIAWILYMHFNSRFGLYGASGTTGTSRWVVVLCIAFTSFVSGVAVVPGSALLLCVLFLVGGLGVQSARDSFLLIQTVVTCVATLQLLMTKTVIEWRTMMYACVGAIVGLSMGLFIPVAPGEQVHFNLGFASVWFAFCVILLISSIHRDGSVFHFIPGWNKDAVARLPNWKPSARPSALCFQSNWISCVLFSTGVMGGVIASILGPGVGMCILTVLVLMFRVSESVANSTAIVVVAVTSLYGVVYRELLFRNTDSEVYHLWLTALPAALVCGLVGVQVGMYLHRRFLIVLTVVVLTAEMTFYLAHIRPWSSHHTGRIALMANAAATFCVSVSFFAALGMFGQHLLYFFDHSELHDESAPTFALAAPPPAPSASGDEEDSGGGCTTGWLYPPKPFLTPQPHRSPTAARLSSEQMSVSEESVVFFEADDAFGVELDSLG